MVVAKFELEEPKGKCKQVDCVGIHLYEHFLSHSVACVLYTFSNLILKQPYEVDNNIPII